MPTEVTKKRALIWQLQGYIKRGWLPHCHENFRKYIKRLQNELCHA